MNENQKKFLELAKYSEELSEKTKEVRDQLNALMLELGIDQYIQDPETLLVYKITRPQGRYVFYTDVDYKRTAKESERGGTILSKKEAEEAGFVLKK